MSFAFQATAILVITRRRFSQITGIYSMLETLVAVIDSEVTKLNLRQ